MLEANRIYAGFVTRGAAKDRSGDILKGRHAPILPVELCDRVAAILALRHPLAMKFHGRHGPGQIYLLSDVLYCAACGHRMAGCFQDGKLWYRHERAKRDCPSKG